VTTMKGAYRNVWNTLHSKRWSPREFVCFLTEKPRRTVRFRRLCDRTRIYYLRKYCIISSSMRRRNGFPLRYVSTANGYSWRCRIMVRKVLPLKIRLEKDKEHVIWKPEHDK